MFATYVVMFMTRQRVMLMAALLQAQPLKTFLRIGYARSAESARIRSLHSKGRNISQKASGLSEALFLYLIFGLTGEVNAEALENALVNRRKDNC